MTDTRQLIAAYLDDALSPAELDELTAWLKAISPGLLDRLAMKVVLQSAIRRALAAQAKRQQETM